MSSPLALTPQGPTETVWPERAWFYIDSLKLALGGKSGEREANVSCSASDLTPASQELHHRLCWLENQPRHSRTISLHGLTDTFSRKAK